MREQLRIAAGEPLARHRPRAAPRATRSRSASTPRTPRADFAPAPGRVDALPPPLGPGVRVDTARRGGRGDPAVLRLADREGDRLRRRPARRDRARDRALDELEVDGIPTTRELALDVLRSDGFGRGRTRPATLRRWKPPALARPTERRRDRAGRSRSAAGRRAVRRSSCSTSGTSPASRSRRSSRASRTSSRSTLARAVAAVAPAPRRARSPPPPTAGPPIAWVRSSATSCASACTSSRRDGAARGRDQRGGRAREALRERGRRAARQRDPRPHRATGRARDRCSDASLQRAEELLERLRTRARRARGERRRWR